MNIEILKENLDAALSIASRVSNKNLSLPVLGCVVFVVGGGRAVVRATNLDVSVEVVLKAKIINDGVVAVPAHTIAQTITSMAPGKITLSVSGNTITVKGDRGKTTITTVDVSEFPTLPYVKEGAAHATLPTRDFIAALRAVVFASATSTIKPELAAVSLSLEHGELIAAATDSFRLAEVKIPIKSKQSFGQVLLPARNVPDIMRSLEGGTEVEVRVGENQCSFVGDFGYLTSRTVDGAFPDYRVIIPKDFSATAVCGKEDVVRAFKKVAIFTDTFNQVHLSLKTKEGVVSLHTTNSSLGEALDEIPGAVQGEDCDINFNIKYIMDALTVVSGDSVKFSIAGAGKPMLITDAPHKGFTYLVMPMNR